MLQHDIRQIHRWDLGTPYPKIVGDLRIWFYSPPLRGSALVADVTGCGKPVYDFLAASGIDAELIPRTITAGFREGDQTVPKIDLVGAVVAALETHRIRRSTKLPLQAVLTKEMENFRVKVTPDRNETYAAGREKENDDVLLAAALAIWYAERCGGPPDDDYAPPVIEPLLPAKYGTPGDWKLS